ncbi:adenylate cyclase, class 2 [Amycolatopsis xylanica]|uniref:Adenylate cyclase, class 2 n=1 Tax=Amycolatopsis xylanica TaxID=589385 RepID=A0A1H3K6P2_9PSEU|nr:class IV adenylate cyclase [Amycolatopsis xylanica]SDY47174.1 adenylate cyclase, class 2 [Amycolatopsis xylanica]
MPIEAELTAVLRNPDEVRAALSARAEVERCTYSDTYYDWPDHRLTEGDYNLRVRTVTTGESTRTLLTFKEPRTGPSRHAKPEHETEAGDAGVLRTIFHGLGLVERIAFRKHCENFHFTDRGHDLLATVAEIPDLAGQTFLELETLVEPEHVDTALKVIRAVLHDLGVTDDDLSTQSYTRRVAALRRS